MPAFPSGYVVDIQSVPKAFPLFRNFDHPVSDFGGSLRWVWLPVLCPRIEDLGFVRGFGRGAAVGAQDWPVFHFLPKLAGNLYYFSRLT